MNKQNVGHRSLITTARSEAFNESCLKFEIPIQRKVVRFSRIIVFFHRALPRNWPRALMRPKPQGHASHFKFPAVPCEFLIRVGSTNDRGRSIDSSREMIGEL